MEINDLQDIPRFARYLAIELQKQGLHTWSDEVASYDHVWGFPATEYLGEFRILLKELLRNEPLLPKSIQPDVKSAIQSLNKSFGGQ